MSRRTPRFSTVPLLAALCSGLAAAPRDTPQTQQPQPTFRAGVTAVPLDVRVLDKDGKPVTDLTAQDFTIVEDGAPQEIAHFSRQILSFTINDYDRREGKLEVHVPVTVAPSFVKVVGWTTKQT